MRWIKKNSNCFYSISVNRLKQKDCFYGKICIKASLKIEKTQAVCCSHPQNILFLLNSNKSFTVIVKAMMLAGLDQSAMVESNLGSDLNDEQFLGHCILDFIWHSFHFPLVHYKGFSFNRSIMLLGYFHIKIS